MIKILFFVLLVVPICTTAQREKKSLVGNTSYFGRIFTHPGIKIGTDIVVFQTNRDYEESKQSSLIHRLIMNNNFGYYYHKNNQHGLFVNTEMSYGLEFIKGIYFRLGGGIGYLRTFLDGKVYEVTSNGKVKRIPLAGNNYFMPSANFTLGHKIRKSNLMHSWFLTIGNFWQYPSNTRFLLNPTLEFGVRWYIKNKPK